MATASLPPADGSDHLTSNVPRERIIGALWRRLVAALIDAIVVGIIGALVALPFFDALSRLGAWGRLLGFCLALPYYGLLNSRIGNGQTLGKRWLRLQLVNAHSDTISVPSAFIRFLAFSAPFFLSNLTLPITRTPEFVLYAITAIVFGLGGITIYLILFNRRTRQGVHDLAVGTYVVSAERSTAVRFEPIWKGHLAIVSALLVVGIVAGRMFQSKMQKLYNFPAMLADVQRIEAMEGVQAAGVRDLTVTNSSGGDKKRIYIVNVFWSGGKGEEQGFANRVELQIREHNEEKALADRVALQIMEHNPQVMDRNRLRVVIIRGYDLGIVHAQVSHPFEDEPAKWKAKLAPE